MLFAPQILRIRNGRAEGLWQAQAVEQCYYRSASRRHSGAPPHGQRGRMI